MTTNEIVKVLTSHPETADFAQERVNELVAEGLNTEYEVEIDRLQRQLIEAQARLETAEEYTSVALQGQDKLATYIT